MSTDVEKDDGQGENALMPDIYTENPVAKPIDIMVVNRSSDDESVGFDPYDTATLYKNKW